MKLKATICKDETLYRDWSHAHTWCQACGRTRRACDFRGLSTHHICKPFRSHEACNLLRLCGQCHDAAEGLRVPCDGDYLPRLGVEICATIKLIREPEEFDGKRLIILLGRSFDLEPIPDAIEEMYRGNRPRDKRRWQQ